MTAQELKDAGQKLYTARRYAEAVPLLKSAAEAFPTDEQLWQELVLAAHHGGQCEQAVDFAKQAIRQHPRSGWLWRQLGSELTTVDRLDEAEKAFDNARSLLAQNDGWIWRYLAALHRKRKNLEKEIDALENLNALGEANSADLNRLGTAYYSNRDLAKALESYRLSTAAESDGAPSALFNMGLVYNDPEVSQDADAADAYRRYLALKPDDEPAKQKLHTTKQKLVPVAEKARTATTGLTQSDDLFRFYISPFEVLRIAPPAADEELDVKVVQHAKKRLVHEIDLNDGKVSWLDDYALDKSSALMMDDQLHDGVRLRYHRAIFQNTRLLRFLTRGEIDHFLYSDEYFPQDTLELLDQEPGFHAFLSKPFARQYNLVLSRAIDHRLFPVVEVLFDGRRWVEPEDEDICFEGASRWVKQRLEWIEQQVLTAVDKKPSVLEVEKYLADNSVVDIFNLLPPAFHDEQNRFVAAIRSLAIACHNKHDDSAASAALLVLCNRFHFKSVDLSKRLGDDAEAITGILEEKEKQKVFANLTPIKAAPSLHTVNGIGFALYGRADHDTATGSYLATYYFVFLAIPVFPIRRYRVCPIGNGYRFFGSLPLSMANKWHLFISLASLVGLIIWCIVANNAPSGSSYSSTPSPPTYGRPTAPRTPAFDSKAVYRASLNAELEKEGVIVDNEKAKAQRIRMDIESLGREIDRLRPTLDHASQFAVDAFNRKVDTYNALLEQGRAQERLVNSLVSDYNDKVRKFNQ